MTRDRVEAGGFPRAGYPNIEWSIQHQNSRLGDLDLCVQWIKTTEMLLDAQRLLDQLRRGGASELDI